MLKRTGHRNIRVLMPNPEKREKGAKCMVRGTSCLLSDGSADKGLEALHKRKETAGMLVLRNKMPAWDRRMEAYVLDFNGRVGVPSVKNFIITDQESGSNLVLFGKNGEDVYSLDFEWPMSVFQAFAIGISSIAGKFCCE